MNIVLIGYRGTGKTEVGNILAKRLDMPCVGMDARIVERAGMPIPQIVERYGWEKFRDLESELALDLAARDDLVIDAGGGVIERPENMEALGKNALVVWLKASPDTIVERIRDDSQRPALTEGRTFTDEVAEVLEARTPKYRSAAMEEIDTDGLSPEKIADEIAKMARL